MLRVSKKTKEIIGDDVTVPLVYKNDKGDFQEILVTDLELQYAKYSNPHPFLHDRVMIKHELYGLAVMYKEDIEEVIE